MIPRLWKILLLTAAVQPVCELIIHECRGRDKPNVVLIVADYMGYGDTGPYGAPDTRTPSLDRLAREGVRLTDAYAAAPICTPSRAAFLTGRYPQKLGMENNVSQDRPAYGLGTDQITVARLLRDSGYTTAMFGKWHLGYQPQFGPNAHGFDRFLGFLDWSIDYYSHRTYEGEAGLYDGTEPVERQGYSTDIFSSEAAAFIEQHSRRPFFLFVAFNAALPPTQPPGTPQDIRSKESWDRSSRADYIKVVEAMDRGIGQVLEALDRSELTDRTLVIFTYDHGGRELSRPDPLFHGFATLWEGGIRVPLILRWPDHLPANAISSQISINMDLAVSILAAAGVSLPSGRAMDGMNLLPVLQGETAPQERVLFWRIAIPNRRQKAVRRERWKYLWDGGTPMLFDVRSDPGEHRNLFYEDRKWRTSWRDC